MSDGPVLYEMADHVATITLNRPAVRNAMNTPLREAMFERFTALARELAGKAPVALRYAKEAVVKGLELSLADGHRLEGDLSTLLRTTEDRLEGARAFLEKRKPNWKGR